MMALRFLLVENIWFNQWFYLKPNEDSQNKSNQHSNQEDFKANLPIVLIFFDWFQWFLR